MWVNTFIINLIVTCFDVSVIVVIYVVIQLLKKQLTITAILIEQRFNNFDSPRKKKELRKFS